MRKCLIAISMLFSLLAAAQQEEPFRNATLPVETRAQNLLVSSHSQDVKLSASLKIPEGIR